MATLLVGLILWMWELFWDEEYGSSLCAIGGWPFVQ